MGATSTQAGRFHPPEGLLPHEQVVFVSEKGGLGIGLPAVLILFGFLFLGIGLFFTGGSCKVNGVPQPPSVCAQFNPLFAAIGGLMVFGGLYVGFQGTRQRGTKYFVTTFRLVEARRQRIVREVSQNLFRGREFSQFLERKPGMIVNGVPFFSIKILNPESGDPLMTLKNLPPESVTSLEMIGQSIYCQYCGTKNDAKNTTCSQCGANL